MSRLLDHDPGRRRERQLALFRSRLRSLLLLFLLLGAALLARLIYLQLFLHDHYSTLSWDNRVRVLPIAPRRGLIYSADGETLAENRVLYDLLIVPEHAPNLDHLITRLRRWIAVSDEDVARFQAQKRRAPPFQPITLRANLDDRERAAFAVNLHLFPGAEVLARLGRHYPQGPAFAHILGYLGRGDAPGIPERLERQYHQHHQTRSHVGRLGVERSREKILHGRAGYQQVEVNARGRIVRILERAPPQAGVDVQLAVSASLQRAAWEALADRRGAIVALDVRNGDVLAAVSSPSYDPNAFADGIDTRYYQGLLDAPDAPLFNRFLSGEYPPGSTLKPFWGWLALHHELRRLDTTLHCPGRLTVNRHVFRDWKNHGTTGLRKAIVESCDVYFYQLAMDMGIDRLHAGLLHFGFGQRSGVETGAERPGLVPSAEWKRRSRGGVWLPGESVLLGIGQGYILVTPMQLARAAAALANGGLLLRPRLVRRAGERREPVQRRRIIASTDEHLPYILAAMHGVVTHGTARASGAGALYEFAGKTGTAQRVALPADGQQQQPLPEELRDHALFIAFAPLPAPEIALAVIVENGGSGSAVAAPIARALLDHYLLRERT